LRPQQKDEAAQWKNFQNLKTKKTTQKIRRLPARKWVPGAKKKKTPDMNYFTLCKTGRPAKGREGHGNKIYMYQDERRYGMY